MGTSPVMLSFEKKAPAHEHSFGSWTDCGDGEHHKRVCQCGETEMEDHTWNQGIVKKAATSSALGEMTFTCTKCGASFTLEIPKLSSANAWPYNPKTGDPAGIWLLLLVFSAAALGILALRRRKI